MDQLTKLLNMNVNELVKELFEKGSITKDEIIEFGKLCQLHILNDVFELNNERNTYVKVKNNINMLKQDLLLDDNKFYISVFNYSLN